eukprot:scaffold125466_cov35-Tisochrysis_lutea.AAC.3
MAVLAVARRSPCANVEAFAPGQPPHTYLLRPGGHVLEACALARAASRRPHARDVSRGSEGSPFRAMLSVRALHRHVLARRGASYHAITRTFPCHRIRARIAAERLVLAEGVAAEAARAAAHPSALLACSSPGDVQPCALSLGGVRRLARHHRPPACSHAVRTGAPFHIGGTPCRRERHRADRQPARARVGADSTNNTPHHSQLQGILNV